MCAELLGLDGTAGLTYLGDAPYELELARAAGLDTVDVASLAAPKP